MPGKNVRKLAGKPLIAWTIECALKVADIDRVMVSTDSHEIAEISEHYGAEVPFLRPIELATDSSPEWDSWRHAINYLRSSSDSLPERFVSLPPTSPLRFSHDIENCLSKFNMGIFDVVLTMSQATRNPYYNMVKMNDDGTIQPIIATPKNIYRRQDAPVVFDLTTVCYVTRPNFILTHDSLFEGRVGSVVVPKERAVDIDSIEDFNYAEFLMNSRGVS